MADGGLNFLFDENFSQKHVAFLADEASRALNVRIQHLRKLGWGGQPDVEWMPRAVEAGFTIVTGDRNERTRRVTNAEFARLGADVLLFGPFWDHRLGWERAKWLVAHLDRIVAGARSGDGVRLVDASGRLRAVI